MPKKPIWNSLEVLVHDISFKDGETEPFVTRREKVVKSKSKSVNILFFFFSPFFPINFLLSKYLCYLCSPDRVDIFINIVPLLNGDDRQYIIR